jgi:hypothetical protein
MRISNKEANDFKKYYEKTINNPNWKYLEFLADEDQLDCGTQEIFDIFGVSNNNKEECLASIESIERARQFIILINPSWDNIFLEAIDDLKMMIKRNKY